MHVSGAWPNTFHQSRFLSAAHLVQADRLKRRVAFEMEQIDLQLVPSLCDEMLSISNQIGHPLLKLRTGFVAVDSRHCDWASDLAHPPIRLRAAAPDAEWRHAFRQRHSVRHCWAFRNACIWPN